MQTEPIIMVFIE